MSIQGIRKDVQELKRVASFESEQSNKNRLKKLTDEDLQEELDKELAKLGFESIEEFYDSAKKYFAENGLKTEFNNDYEFQDYVSEKLLKRSENYLEDFVLKYGNSELLEKIERENGINELAEY